jgi:hypothetical protein
MPLNSQPSALHWRFLSLGIAFSVASAFSQPALTIRTASNGVELRFQGSQGTTNQVQWIGNLGVTNWTTLTNIVVSSNQLVTVVDSGVMNLSARFYRVAIGGLSQTNAETAILLDNLSNTTDGANGAGSVDVSGGTPLVDASRVAAGFTVGGANQSGSWTFTIAAENPNSAPVVLTLVNNNGGMPDETAAFALSTAAFVSSLPGGGSGYMASGSGTLSANTTYWLVASAGSDLDDFYSWVERRLTGNASYTGSATFAGVQLDNAGWGTQNNFYPGLTVTVIPAP